MSEKVDKRKQSFYLPEKYIEEIQKEAIRLDRSLSWIIQRAWVEAKEKIQNYPSFNDD